MSIQCNSKRLCVVVPFRDRYEDLAVFGPKLNEFLSYQAIDYEIVVVNQLLNAQFNRGKLLNVGFLENESNFDYFIFHDVDIYPLVSDKLKNATSEEEFGFQGIPNYKYDPAPWSIVKPGQRSAGTIFKISKEAYRKVNGHTNCLWGWGYEDNDLYYRITSGANLHIHEQGKRSSGYGKWSFGFTRPHTGWAEGHEINQGVVGQMWGENLIPNMQVDGLNSCTYKVDSVETKSEYHCKIINVYL